MCENQQFLLRWHRHSATITQILPEILKSGSFADVTLSVDTQCIKAHKLVLASCSEYFLKLFKNLDINEHPVVIITQCNFQQLLLILEFIYTGNCQVEKSELPVIFSIADNLKINGLSGRNLQENLNEINNNNSSSSPPKKINKNKNRKKAIPKMTPMINLKQNLTGISPVKKNQQSRDGTETCKCFICGKYLSNQYNLRVHIETHKETYHACLACPHVSRSRDALRKHVSYRHPENYNNRKKKSNTNVAISNASTSSLDKNNDNTEDEKNDT